MAGHVVDLTVFLAQPEPPAFFPRIVILDFQPDHGAHAREGESHHGDQRAIAQPDYARRIHAVEQLAGFRRGDYSGGSLLHRVPRAADGMRGIQRKDLAGDQPIEEHAQAGEVLFDRRRGPFPAQLLDVSGHVDRLQFAQLR